jgi:NADPH:quinone reductase-like Zn-dependent oxidoreductase
MKAAVHTRYGPPEVVRVSDVDKPTITDGEVLVKVHATTVNRTDCAFPGGEAPRHEIHQRAGQATGGRPRW